MSMTNLSTLIDKQVTHLGGALTTSFGLPSNPQSYRSDSQVTGAFGNDQLLQFSTVDGTGGNEVRWITTLNSSLTSIEDLPNDARYRLYAWTALSRLHGEQLVAACRSIMENYPWFLSAGTKKLAPPEPQRIKAKTGQIVERPPISFDED